MIRFPSKSLIIPVLAVLALFGVGLLSPVFAQAAAAAPAPKLDSGDTAWMIVSTPPCWC